jgi:multiple sugar transport system ATP-binding protein
MAAVEIVGVHKTLGTTPVARGVDLAVRDGEFLVLVGPSGCGKSTLLRLIAGLETPDGGDVLFDGRRMNDVPPRDRDVGMVFQSYALYPHLSVADNLAFGLRIRRTPEAEIKTRVTDVAQLLGLESLLRRLPRELSGGQRQRVAMGRAMIRRPRLFLFDEPLSNLDAALRVHLRSEILALHRRLQTTIIYVTHDQVEAMTLADRIAVLDQGRVRQVGTPAELFHRPVHRFVAGFLGTPSMNMLEGVGEEVGEGTCFRMGDARISLPSVRRDSMTRARCIGLRPHDVRLLPARSAGRTNREATDRSRNVEPTGGPGVVARVELVESMGWESFVHVVLADSGAQRLVARVEGSAASNLRVDEPVRVILPTDRCFVFDGEGHTLHWPESDDAASMSSTEAGSAA